MLTKEFLENVCNQIKYKPIREDISEELSLHIQEQKEEYIKEGFGEKIAEEKAVSNMGEADEIGKKLNKIHKPKFDWMLFLLVAILIGFGFLITSIKVQRDDGIYYLKRHIVYFVLGLIVSIGIYFLDYIKILNHPKIVYTSSTFLLIIAILFGKTYAGGRLYLSFWAMTCDPTDLCILLYIIAFVGFIKNLNNKSININIQNFNFKLRIDICELVILSVVSIFLLIFMNRIAITTVLMLSYIIITTAYIFKLPNRKNDLIKLYGTLVILGTLLIGYSAIAKNGIYSRIQRGVSATYNYERDLHGNGWMGYQINNVLDNSHLFSGLDNMESYAGLFDGGTNHALITIIAYCGSFYSAIVIGVVMLFAIKLIIDSKKIKDVSGKLLIVGFGSFILLQSFFNILMNFNLIPIIDLNLPFVSYGGSGFLISMTMASFILSIYRRKDILTKKDEESKKIKFKISFE